MLISPSVPGVPCAARRATPLGVRGGGGDTAPVTPPPTVPDAPAAPVRAERRAVVDVLGAALLFAGCNVAWRYGGGSTVTIVFLRAAVGIVFAWLLGRRRRAGWRDALRTRAGLVAVLSGAASMVAAGTMFRTLDGPLAGLALACVPAVAMVLRDRVGPLAATAALGSSVAAAVGILGAAGTDDGTDVGWVAVVVAVVFIAVEIVSMRSAQLAVEEGIDPTAVVTASMVAATIASAPFALAVEVTSGTSGFVSAAAAAVVVAGLGTLGRVLRTTALPAAGVPSVAAAAQVTALGTVVGGVVLLGDDLSALDAVTAVAAAGLGALAVIAGSRWRLARDRTLAASLDVRPVPAPD